MPGDRKSKCQSKMKPLGLTRRSDGELMVVHRCLNCGKISYNRIAGDDNTYALLTLLSDKPDQITQGHPGLLTKEDTLAVQSALFGMF